MALNTDFRVKNSLHVGSSACFIGTVDAPVYLSAGTDLLDIFLQNGEASASCTLSAGTGITTFTYTGATNAEVSIDGICDATWNSAYTTVAANSATWDAGGGGGGGSNLEILDEGSSLTSTASAINFIGSGVTATNIGAVQTVTINGDNAAYDSTHQTVSALSGGWETASTWVTTNGSNAIDTIATGSVQGQIAVTDVGGTTTQVNVKGLGTTSGPTFAAMTRFCAGSIINDVTVGVGAGPNRISTFGANTLILGGGNGKVDIGVEGASSVSHSDLNVTGQLTLSGTSASIAGASNSVLTQTASGMVTTDTIDSKVWGGAVVDYATSTTNAVPKFTDGTGTIGDSVMSQSGTVISIDGTLSARSLCASDSLNNNIWSSVGLPNTTVTASNNTAIGENALCDLFSGSNNTAIGTSTMAGNTSGSNNVALGDRAMFYALSGDHNFALGQYTLYDNYGGDFNSAIGTAALQCNTTGSNNTALGYRALLNNTTGNDNTAIGECAIDSNVNGIGNTAIGNKALGGNVTGNYNIAIGQCAGAYFADGCTALSGSDDSIYIGRNTRAKDHNDYNTVVIGLSACSCGANTVKIGNGSITAACIQVGWTTVSDERDKKDITDLDKGLTFIGDLKPKAFKMRAARDSSDTQGGCRYGFIAQEVLETEGIGIIVSDSNPNHLGMNQEFLIPILVKGMQEQQEIINDLRERVNRLETV